MSKPFRRRNALAAHDLHYGPNMTPMVDVVMVILIFFMASTAILGPEWFLKSALPTVKAAAAPDADQPLRLEVRLHRAAATTVDINEEKGLTPERADALLAQKVAGHALDKVVVLVEPDDRVPYDDVVRVHETCHRLGIKQVGIADAPKTDAIAPK